MPVTAVTENGQGTEDGRRGTEEVTRPSRRREAGDGRGPRSIRRLAIYHQGDRYWLQKQAVFVRVLRSAPGTSHLSGASGGEQKYDMGELDGIYVISMVIIG
jgi:hypothetical protein